MYKYKLNNNIPVFGKIEAKKICIKQDVSNQSSYIEENKQNSQENRERC